MTESIQQLTLRRGISEVLHFTTGSGLLGIINSDAVLCRDLLSTSQYLEFIYEPNCPYRGKDADWHGYVNLSISRVNAHLLGISRNKWHHDADTWWAVMAFDAAILAEPGVYFASTNNIYTGVLRGTGAKGLNALFAPEVSQWQGKVMTRQPNTPEFLPTDVQAEVLFPQQVPLDKLKAIYVYDRESVRHVHGCYGATQRVPPVEVTARPQIFQ